MKKAQKAREAKKAKIHKTVFKNGLTLVSETRPELRGLSIGIWVKAGTRHEKPSETGISHFLEHMLFKGTEERDALQIAKQVDEVGGEFNAFTAREYTCFHILLLDRDVGLAIDILSDILLNSQFDPMELERERKVILQELSMAEESPEELVHDLFFELIFGRHGLGRPILGSLRSIRRLRRADLLRFFRKHYRPDQLIISVCGSVTHATLRKKIQPLAKRSWPGRPKRHPSKREMGFEPAPKLKEGTWWVVRPSEQVHLVWGVECPKYASKDRFAGLILNGYLGGGMSSSLFQEIREKHGLAYTVYSSVSPFIDTGVFTIYAATNAGQVPLCLKLIEECTRKLSRDLMSEEELTLVKENLKGTILLNADSSESRMSTIATHEIYLGKNTTAEELCNQIDAVTPQDIRRLARKVLARGKRSILALGPRPRGSVRSKIRPKFIKR